MIDAIHWSSVVSLLSSAAMEYLHLSGWVCTKDAKTEIERSSTPSYIGISQFSGIDFMFNANNTKIRPKTKKVQKSTKELKGRQREAHRML